MPRFNWTLLFDKLPGKKVLIIGGLLDASELLSIADNIYLLVDDQISQFNQEDNLYKEKIIKINYDELKYLEYDIGIISCSDNNYNSLRNILNVNYSRNKNHLVYQSNNSNFFKIIRIFIEIYHMKDVLLYFPYKSFISNHFVDIFNKKNCLKYLLQFIKHALGRKEYGVYVPQLGFQSNIENIINNVRISHGLNISMPLRIRSGSTGSYLADLGNYIIRVPHSEFANNQYSKNNYSVLQKLSKMDLPFCVPHPVIKGDLGGNQYYIESKILGASLDHVKKNTPIINTVFGHAIKALNDTKMQVGYFTGQTSYNLIHQEMTGLLNHLTTKQVDLYENFSREFTNMVISMRIPMVITHGDFKYSNFIISQEKPYAINGIIDWEFSPLLWFPLYDFLVLSINHFYRLEGQLDFAKFVLEIHHGHCPDALTELMNGYTENCCLENSFILPNMILCMLRHMNVNFVFQQKQKKIWSDVFSLIIDPLAIKFLRSI